MIKNDQEVKNVNPTKTIIGPGEWKWNNYLRMQYKYSKPF